VATGWESAYSTDGVTWTKGGDPAAYIDEYAIADGGGKFVAGGAVGHAAYSSSVFAARLTFNADGAVGWVRD
jgi:hypothetical protein